jgi:hypothetical protein
MLPVPNALVLPTIMGPVRGVVDANAFFDAAAPAVPAASALNKAVCAMAATEATVAQE